MARAAIFAVSIFVLLLAVGCSGYRELSRPWHTEFVEGEIPSASVLRVGDRLRTTSLGGEVSEGKFVELDEASITLADMSGEARLLKVPTDQIQKLEIFDNGTGKAVRAAAIVVVASGAILAVIDANTGSTFSPDDAPSAKVARY